MKIFDIHTRIKESRGRMKPQWESESLTSNFLDHFCPSIEKERIFRFLLRFWRSQLPATTIFHSTRRKSKIEFRDYYLVIPFSNVRRAWLPSGVRLRGSSRTPWLRFSVRSSFAPGWLYFSWKCCAKISTKASSVLQSCNIRTHDFSYNFYIHFKFVFTLYEIY